MSTPRIVTTLSVFLALAAPAVASPCAGIPKFDAPLVAEPTIVDNKTPRQINIICRNHDYSRKAGCADEVTNTIYLTEPLYLKNLGWSQVEIACLERHERAHLWHVDGTRWAGDHRSIVTH